MLLNQCLGNQASTFYFSPLSDFPAKTIRGRSLQMFSCNFLFKKQLCLHTWDIICGTLVGVHKCIVTNIINKKTNKTHSVYFCLVSSLLLDSEKCTLLCPPHRKFLEETLNRCLSRTDPATSLAFMLILYDVLQKPHFYVFSEIQLSCNRKTLPKPSPCFSWMVYYPFSDICPLYTNEATK